LRGNAKATSVFLPLEITHRVAAFCAASWAIKVDDAAQLPAHYSPFGGQQPHLTAGTPFSTSNALFVPMTPGTRVPLDCTNAKSSVFVTAVKCFHSVTTVGYILSEERLKLKSEYVGIAGNQIAKLRQQGVEVSKRVSVARLAFLCDSTVEVLEHPEQREQIFECPVVMIECTYLEPERNDEASKRGHIGWHQLRPHVEAHPDTLFVLFHFSLRYTDQFIVDFFNTASSANTRPPNVLLWLDSELSLPVMQGASNPSTTTATTVAVQ
jgi:hypothetical protein